MDDLSDSLNKLISRQTEGDILPGIVYGLANRDGVICEGAAGYRNIETHDPMLVDSIHDQTRHQCGCTSAIRKRADPA